MTKKDEKTQTVIACTCRVENYGWIREKHLYNLPLPKDGKGDSYAPVTHLVVYALDMPALAYRAKYVREVDGQWLAANGYKVSPKPHGEKYALFELGRAVAEASLYGMPGADVFVCSTRWTGKIDADFFTRPLPQCGGKSVPNIFERIRPFFGKCRAARAFNPVQMDFFEALGVGDGRTSSSVKSIGDGVKYSLIDLFAGAGGLSEGLEEAGFHGVFASEIVPQYAETYRRNHLGTVVATADVRTLDAEKLRRDLGMKKGQLALIAGGPPCQGFSINAPVRSILDQRNHLFKEYLRFVDAFQPRAVLIENVPGLVSFEDGDTLHAILKALGELGYGADVRILGAAYYGVPQMRWRTIILGLRGKELPRYAFPEPVCHAPIRPNFTATFDGHSLIKTPAADIPGNFVSVEEAIGDLPPLKAGERGEDCKQYLFKPSCPFQRSVRRGSPGIYNHEAPKLSPINLQRLKHIKPGGNWTDIPYDLLPRGMKLARKSDHTKRYGRLTPDGLASTILTKCDPHWGAYFHYAQDRSLTVREAARCQSFPDHYIFYGSQQEQFAQVGNAVPPMLAKAVGVAIKAVLDEEEK